MKIVETLAQNARTAAREEKISHHCNVLAEIIVAMRDVYNNSALQQKAFIETMIGAAIWYIPKPINAWTGYASLGLLKSFHPQTGVVNPKISEEHVYPRKVAARLLIENLNLNGEELLSLFKNEYGRLHYITPDENKSVIQFQKDSVFKRPEEAYKLAKIELILIKPHHLKLIKKRDINVISTYLNE